uniref:Uncharacterized protein n=1 Tax=Solanum lycopersicum TaxID=4081 RepID=A0A3Q7IVP0_SOLLC
MPSYSNTERAIHIQTTEKAMHIQTTEKAIHIKFLRRPFTSNCREGHHIQKPRKPSYSNAERDIHIQTAERAIHIQMPRRPLSSSLLKISRKNATKQYTPGQVHAEIQREVASNSTIVRLLLLFPQNRATPAPSGVIVLITLTSTFSPFADFQSKDPTPPRLLAIASKKSILKFEFILNLLDSPSNRSSKSVHSGGVLHDQARRPSLAAPKKRLMVRSR